MMLIANADMNFEFLLSIERVSLGEYTDFHGLISYRHRFHHVDGMIRYLAIVSDFASWDEAYLYPRHRITHKSIKTNTVIVFISSQKDKTCHIRTNHMKTIKSTGEICSSPFSLIPTNF